jgi:uncharacterized protein
MANLQSPCKKICVMDPVHRLCSGCGRTIQEIGNWMNFSETERQAINKKLDDRLKILEGKN